MFIKKLDINEFRGIKKCKKPIELSRFTVLLGRNNSGKSTILEALYTLPHPAIVDGITGKNRITTILENHPPLDQGNKPILYGRAGTAIISYYFPHSNPKLQIDESSYIYNNENAYFQAITPQDLTKLLDTEFKDDKSIRNSVLFIPNNTNFFQSLEIIMDSLKDLIMKTKYHIKVAEILNSCVDDKYTDIYFSRPIVARKVTSDNSSMYLPLSYLGQGPEKIVKIMVVMEILNPKLLLIDDFEAGLHPSMIKVFLNWLKEKEWQVVISTHSIDVLDKLVELEFIDASVLLLRKSKDDILDYKILDYKKLENYLNANSDPRLLPDGINLNEL